MRHALLALALFLSGLTLAGCKFESSSAFDNNCSGNGGIRNEGLCDQYFLK